MIVIAAIIGALSGWVFADLDAWGFWVGGIVGAPIGWAMRSAVRKEAAAVSERLWTRWQTERQMVATDTPVAVAVPAPAVASPTEAARARVIQASRLIEASSTSAPTSPAPPPEASGPSPGERAITAVRAWLLGGNTIVRAGLLLLFVGLSFLARYAAAAGLFPIELRLVCIALFGIALLTIGFRTRVRRPDFAMALQGGGIAVLYLTVFAAARFFDLLPLAPAFALMVVICAFACALALMQDSQGLAGAAFAGGFATPLLLGGDVTDPLLPFGYYTLLNLAVLFIAARRAWRWLNLIGFVATFGAATMWGMVAYAAQYYLTAQLFLIVSVLIYVVAGVLYAGRSPGKLGNAVDGTLLFGPALAGFGLQAGLVHGTPFATAFSALAFAALYLVTAIAIGRRRDELTLLREGALAVGIGFVTLAVPLALGARWTSSVWALEGAGAVWLGTRQSRWGQRAFGLALQGVAVLVFVASLGAVRPDTPLLDPGFIGAMLVALPLLATAWWLREPKVAAGTRRAAGFASVEAALAPATFLGGFALWCAGWAIEAMRVFAPTGAVEPAALIDARSLTRLAVMLVFVASAGIAALIGRRTDWRVATWPSRATLAVLALVFVAELGDGLHVLRWPGVAIWAVAIAAHGWLLRLNDRDAKEPAGWLVATHVGGVWLVMGIVADTLRLGIDRGHLWDTSWAGVSFLAVATATLVALTLGAGHPRSTWPIDRQRIAYLWIAAVPVAVLVYLGTLLTAAFAAGDTAPLPYVPLLNPVDLAVFLGIATLLLWHRRVSAVHPAPTGSAMLGDTPFLSAIAAVAFVAVNSIWLRFAHHFLAVPWSGPALLDDVVVQTGLAILWTLLALALMVVAHHRAARGLWLTGAGLLGLTVVKLLLVDLNNVGGAARIVAFIVVGVLMLVVGYLAPLPPRRPVDQDAV